jgi:hypothetical protein
VAIIGFARCWVKPTSGHASTSCVECASEDVAQGDHLREELVQERLINIQMREWTSEQIETRDHPTQMANNYFKYLYALMSSIQSGPFYACDEFQNLYDNVPFLHENCRAEGIDGRCPKPAEVIIACIGYRM